MKRNRLAWAVALVALVLSVSCVVVAVFVSASKATQIRESQVTNTRTLENTDRTLTIIEDCTTPGGECYERSQKQTASAVADINRVVIIAAACASKPGPQTVEQIQACVISRLAASEQD